MDARDKGLILARLLGYRGAAPSPQSLVPDQLRSVSIDQFFAKLPSFDKEWADRAAREKRRAGAALRRDGDAAVGHGKARRRAGVEPDGLARRHAKPDRLHDAPVSQRAARGQRAGPDRRSRRRGSSTTFIRWRTVMRRRSSPRPATNSQRVPISSRQLVVWELGVDPVHDRAHPMINTDAMLRLILNSRVYDVAQETPLDRALACRGASATRSCSSARICSRSSATSCAAPTTASRT